MSKLEDRFKSMLSEPKTGIIYYIACTETRRLKIGYTRGRAEKRLSALQTGSASDLIIMAAHPGNLDDERFLHEYFADRRLRGEWFEMSKEMLEHLCMVTWMSAKGHLLFGFPLEDWVRSGLKTMHEDLGGLPEDLVALI